jgi:ferredoxin
MRNIHNKKRISKVVVDSNLCIGAATCIVVAPKVFDLDSEGIAVVIEKGECADDNTLFMAAQSCPTQAIFLYDENGVLIFPTENTDKT